MNLEFTQVLLWILNIWEVWIWSFGQIQVEMKAHFKRNLVKNRPNLICQDSKRPKKSNPIKFTERPNKRSNPPDRWSDPFQPMIRPGRSNPYFDWLRVSFSVTRPNRVECGLGPNLGWLDPWTTLVVLERFYYVVGFFFFLNIMLTWKIVGVSKVSVLYIYIYTISHILFNSYIYELSIKVKA